MTPEIRARLRRGLVIPAHPLALDARRRLDERRQRALTRYYIAAGAGGLALGVHTTQFEIRDPKIGLFQPVLELAAEEMKRTPEQLVRIGGVCGQARQAMAEARTIRDLGYHVGLLSLAALPDASEDELLAHCRAVADVIPLMGFYLQPAVGGRPLAYSFWRRFAEIANVVAIKIAPFNRYQTIDVVRAVAESGRDDIALYTGNDDNIVLDLMTPFLFGQAGTVAEHRIVGGLLGHWAVWTRQAVDLLDDCRRCVAEGGAISEDWLRRAIETTDANAAIFDARHGFAGCIPGLHEILRRQGLLEGVWCLNPALGLSPGQSADIERIYRAYPHLNDDDFVRENLDRWLEG